jgi:hypothetical protein
MVQRGSGSYGGSAGYPSAIQQATAHPSSISNNFGALLRQIGST